MNLESTSDGKQYVYTHAHNSFVYPYYAMMWMTTVNREIPTKICMLKLLRNVACNFKKIPMITQDLSRRSTATSGESVSTYPRRPKAEAFRNAVDVVKRLHDPTDPSTERTAPPSSAHVQLDDDPRTPIQQGVGDEFRQHDGMVTMMMFYRRRVSPKHRNDMTKVEYGGGGTAHS